MKEMEQHEKKKKSIQLGALGLTVANSVAANEDLGYIILRRYRIWSVNISKNNYDEFSSLTALEINL